MKINLFFCALFFASCAHKTEAPEKTEVISDFLLKSECSEIYKNELENKNIDISVDNLNLVFDKTPVDIKKNGVPIQSKIKESTKIKTEGYKKSLTSLMTTQSNGSSTIVKPSCSYFLTESLLETKKMNASHEIPLTLDSNTIQGANTTFEGLITSIPASNVKIEATVDNTNKFNNIVVDAKASKYITNEVAEKIIKSVSSQLENIKIKKAFINKPFTFALDFELPLQNFKSNKKLEIECTYNLRGIKNGKAYFDVNYHMHQDAALINENMNGYVNMDGSGYVILNVKNMQESETKIYSNIIVSINSKKTIAVQFKTVMEQFIQSSQVK